MNKILQYPWYITIPVWVVISFLISAFSVKFFAVYLFGFLETDSEAISNIFVGLFTVISGIGSIFWAIATHKEKKNDDENKEEKDRFQQSFLALEPRTVEDFFLDDLNHSHTPDISESDVGKIFWLNKNSLSSEFTLIDKGYKFLRFVHNILRKDTKERPLLFVLENSQNVPVIPSHLYICYKMKDTGGTTVEKNEFTDLEGYTIKESIKHNGVIKPNRDPIFLYATDSDYEFQKDDVFGKSEEYDSFYEEIKKTKKFFVIVAFSTVDNKDEIISSAYRASVGIKKDVNGNDVCYIINFTPVVEREQIKSFVGNDFIEKNNVRLLD